MRKVFLCLIIFIDMISFLSAKEIKVKELENGTYSIKGKYHTYIRENKEFLELLKIFPKVLNSKYDFIDKIPNYVFVKEERNNEFYDTFDSTSLRFYYFDEGDEDLTIQTVHYTRVEVDEKCAFRPTEKLYFSMEEWYYFKQFLEEIETKEIFLSEEAVSHMEKNNISSVSEWKSLIEKKEREEQRKVEELKIQKEIERLAKLKEQKRDTYSSEDLYLYMANLPDSFLPYPDKEFIVHGKAFAIETARINGNGIDYLVSYAGNYGLIYIYGENLTTMPTLFLDGMGYKEGITFQNDYITLKYTGKSELVLSKYGNKIDVPVFIAK